jgi:MFS family permease
MQIVALLWGAFTLNYIDRQVVFSIYPTLIQELHFSSAQLGLIGSTFTLVYSLTMPLSGWLADRFSRHRLVIASLLLWSGATAGTAIAASVETFLFWRAMMGVTEALFMPAALGMIAERHVNQTRSRALSLFATGQFVGTTLGGVLGGWMADHFGWRQGFTALAVIGVCYTLVFRLARGKEPDSQLRRREAPDPLGILRSKTWLAIAGAFFFYCAVLWVLLAWLADFIHARYSLSLTASGFSATAFVQLGLALGVVTGGFLGDRLAQKLSPGRVYVAGIGLAASAPFAWCILATHSLQLLAIFSFVFGALSGTFVANLYAGAYDVIPERNYGFAAGVMNLLGGFAGATAVFLTGILKDQFGIASLMRWMAAGTSAAAIGMLIVAAIYFSTDQSRALSTHPQPATE